VIIADRDRLCPPCRRERRSSLLKERNQKPANNDHTNDVTTNSKFIGQKTVSLECIYIGRPATMLAATGKECIKIRHHQDVPGTTGRLATLVCKDLIANDYLNSFVCA